jgi:uncharacterized membrane protein
MKTDHNQEERDDSAEDNVTDLPSRQSTCNDPLTKAAYDWNNALQIATEKMWGEHAPLLRIVPQDKKGDR